MAKFISLIKGHKDSLAILVFILFVGVFFYQTVIFWKLPVPSDDLVGLYHPYRDFYAREYPNGIPFKNFLITDPVRQQIPWRKAATDALRQKKLPLWDASSFFGAPLLANIQTGSLYPLNFFFLFLPFAVAWTLLIISQPLLAGIFMYFFLRHKKLEVSSSLIGAITFAFCGFSIVWLTWGTMLSTLLWIPLTLLSVDRIQEDGPNAGLKWGIICLLSLVCSFFAGHLQIFSYGVVLILSYVLWNYGGRKLLPVRSIYILIITSVVLITMPQWSKLLQWLPQTVRGVEGALWKKEGFFIPVRHLVQFIAPDYFGNPSTLNYWGTWNYGEMTGYVGIAGIMLAAIGLSSGTLFWLFMIGVAFLFAVATPISATPFQLHIPLVSALQPTRLLSVVDLSLSVLAAYGFSKIVHGKGKRTIVIVLIGFFGLLIGLWISVLFNPLFGIVLDNSIVAQHNLVLPTLLIFLLTAFIVPVIWLKGATSRKYFTILGIAITLFCIVDLFRFGWKFTPFTDGKYFFPETRIISYIEKIPKPFRIIASDDRIMPPNVSGYYDIESVGGYDPIHSGRYEEFIAVLERGKPDILAPFGFDRIIAPKNIYSPLLSLLNVRYILTFDELHDSKFRKVMEEGKTKLYELVNWSPRAYLAQNVLYHTSKQEIMDALYNPDFVPGFTAIVEKPVSILNLPLASAETMEIRSYRADEVQMNIRVNMPRLLVISNSFDDGWHAVIDNTITPVFRTNYVFMGVIVPAGIHQVTLRYY